MTRNGNRRPGAREETRGDVQDAAAEGKGQLTFPMEFSSDEP